MMRIALIGNTQMQEGRLRRLLSVEAEIITEAAIRGAHTTPVDVDAVLAIRFDAADSALVHCRLLQCSGVGVDGIAFAALPQDCIVANVHEHEIPVAEYVMLGILEHRIGMATMVAGFSNAAWGELFRRRVPHGELAGATLGLVGMGRIGKAIATRARAFGMRVLAVTATGRPVPEADRVDRLDQLDALLAEADFLVLACPLTDATRGLIGRHEFSVMKPSALLINVARGEVVDERALFEAASEQAIAGALIDTWYRYPTKAEPDPAPSQFPFDGLANVRCTPHTAGWTEGLVERRYRVMADNLARLARGEPLLNVVWRDGRSTVG